jgi:hypothetical protein
LTSKGESIAVKMSSLSRVEEALKAFGEGRILGHYPGRAITRVGDLVVLNCKNRHTLLISRLGHNCATLPFLILRSLFLEHDLCSHSPSAA